MTPSLDSFAAQFDSIEVDPARMPSQQALAAALAACATPDGPGFYLLDDANGRFVVDREFGMVMLRDEALLERERNTIHRVRLRVIEASGQSYDLDLKLRLTGAVPQVVGHEEEAAARGPWASFFAGRDANAPTPPVFEAAPFAILLASALPAAFTAMATLTLRETPPAPAPRNAAWAI